MMFAMPASPCVSRIEARRFELPTNRDQADALFEWLDEGERAAIITDRGIAKVAVIPVATYNRLDDISLKEAYLPHWELTGFAIEDMPTIHDLLWAADEPLLLGCMREVLEGAISPNGNPNIAGAISHAKALLHCLKDSEFDSCDGHPRVVMPLVVYYDYAEEKGCVSEIETRTFDAEELRKPKPMPLSSKAQFWWSNSLGYKAWFGGLNIRDSHRALAWHICKMLRDSFVDYGIWFGEPPAASQSELVRELNEGATDDLHERMRELAGRLVPVEDLVELTFEVGAAELESFEKLCHESGLSVQNALHIAILRLIRDPEGF